MKIYLVNPRFPVTFLGQEYACRMVGKRYTAPPLPLLTVAGLTPPDVELELCDENAHPIRWGTDADLIALTGMHIQRLRLLEIARRFRRLGKRIVIGGPSVTAMPEWYRLDADVLIRGEAERLWPRFLRDLQVGRHQAEYHETGQVALGDSPVPRYDLLKMHHYAYVTIQTTRGCPFSCEFCDIITLYGRQVRAKSVEQVMREVERVLSLGARRIFFVDDNFVGSRPHAQALLEALRTFSHRLQSRPVFSCQTTVNVAKDPALLQLMSEAGMRMMFLGVETPRAASLAETHKYQNLRTDLLRAIETIQSYGIIVSMGTIVGFDHDDASIFDEHVEFVTQAKVTLIMPSQLMALPGTALYHRMRAEGRLRDAQFEDDRWYADGQCLESNILPRQMTNDQLTQGYLSMLLRLYEPTVFAKRLVGELHRLNHARNPSRSGWLEQSVVWLGFGWILGWYLADRHRWALLRTFWSVVPRLLGSLRPVACFALMRLVHYRHMYRLIQSWELTRQRQAAARASGTRPLEQRCLWSSVRHEPIRVAT